MRRVVAGILACILAIGAGCTKRQILPISVAGVGGGLMAGGFIYSATRPEGSGFFGATTGEAAAIGGLVFGGIALGVTGVLFAITSIDCESDDDCWSGDVCVTESRTCVDRESVAASSGPPPVEEPPAAPGAEPPVPEAEPAAPE